LPEGLTLIPQFLILTATTSGAWTISIAGRGSATRRIFGSWKIHFSRSWHGWMGGKQFFQISVSAGIALWLICWTHYQSFDGFPAI